MLQSTKNTYSIGSLRFQFNSLLFPTKKSLVCHTRATSPNPSVNQWLQFVCMAVPLWQIKHFYWKRQSFIYVTFTWTFTFAYLLVILRLEQKLTVLVWNYKSPVTYQMTLINTLENKIIILPPRFVSNDSLLDDLVCILY